MKHKEGVEELISREKKIFGFLVFYSILSVFLAILFIFSGFWTFIETSIAVLAMEIIVTGTVKIARPLNTNKEIEKELSGIKEYASLVEECSSDKKSAIIIAVSTYSLVSIAFLLFINFSQIYAALFAAGVMMLYFSIYLLFRHKMSRIVITFLRRSKAISEMKNGDKPPKESKASKTG